jgi:hypothetical protein
MGRHADVSVQAFVGGLFAEVGDSSQFRVRVNTPTELVLVNEGSAEPAEVVVTLMGKARKSYPGFRQIVRKSDGPYTDRIPADETEYWKVLMRDYYLPYEGRRICRLAFRHGHTVLLSERSQEAIIVAEGIAYYIRPGAWTKPTPEELAERRDLNLQLAQEDAERRREFGH